jgi:hypothetical protein
MKPITRPPAYNDYSKFRVGVIAAIKKHLAKGGKLYAGGFVDSRAIGAICPLTCLLDLDSPFDFFFNSTENCPVDKEVSKKLSIKFSNADMWAFIHGFDFHMGTFPSEEKNKFFKLGCKLRATYLPIVK